MGQVYRKALHPTPSDSTACQPESTIDRRVGLLYKNGNKYSLLRIDKFQRGEAELIATSSTEASRFPGRRIRLLEGLKELLAGSVQYS